jgi:hypothetical protein
LAAIAAALEPQQVEISLLLTEPIQINDTERAETFDRLMAMSEPLEIHNNWAATLAGKLAVESLLGGPE